MVLVVFFIPLYFAGQSGAHWIDVFSQLKRSASLEFHFFTNTKKKKKKKIKKIDIKLCKLFRFFQIVSSNNHNTFKAHGVRLFVVQNEIKTKQLNQI